MALFRFHGGVRPAAHKREAGDAPIAQCPLPPRLVLPLRQHAGHAAEPVVDVGQRVRRGERVASAPDGVGAHVHASTSGTVVAIEPHDAAYHQVQAEPCVVIEPDGADEWLRLPPLPDWRETPRATLLARLRDAGVVGLGGAVFPTDAKLAVARDTLILNGAECEPYIACDDRLLRERADDVLAGAALLAHLAGAARVLVAVEDSMREAYAALVRAQERAPLAGADIVRVPTIYPQGGERQLIRVLTGVEVPSGGLPRDIGVVCHNVATAAAAWRAVVHGEALTSRIVTLTGRGVRAPRNYEVRLGTPIEFLVAHAGGYTDAAQRLVMGGPMMGLALPHDGIPVVKATNCVLALGPDDVRASAPELPCIRCGECMRVCPAQLEPQTLLAALKREDWEDVQRWSLPDCIECGCCAYVCPSQIPLVDWYRWGKSELHVQRDTQRRADRARERYDARNARLARDAAERVARVSAKAQERAAAAEPAPTPESQAAPPAPVVAAPLDKSAVLAAIARGKARRAARDADPDAGTS